jgi:hypothetical protein
MTKEAGVQREREASDGQRAATRLAVFFGHAETWLAAAVAGGLIALLWLGLVAG